MERMTSGYAMMRELEGKIANWVDEVEGMLSRTRRRSRTRVRAHTHAY